MKTNLIYSIPLVILLSCQVNPEPIDFGKDACHHCKMTIMDAKFGAEVVTQKGRVYKFDDVNCIHNFMKENAIGKDGIQYNLVIDFSEPQTLINAEKAFYVKSTEVKSPMASQIAAFSSEEAAREMQERWNGEAMDYLKMKSFLNSQGAGF